MRFSRTKFLGIVLLFMICAIGYFFLRTQVDNPSPIVQKLFTTLPVLKTIIPSSTEESTVEIPQSYTFTLTDQLPGYHATLNKDQAFEFGQQLADLGISRASP